MAGRRVGKLACLTLQRSRCLHAALLLGWAVLLQGMQWHCWQGLLLPPLWLLVLLLLLLLPAAALLASSSACLPVAQGQARCQLPSAACESCVSLLSAAS